ncbi:ComEA family DNA-binding protein [Amycolatopsis mongoliensis]|uniref:ComEA family DNA-binding protein n=1 Tax=Amycolatopsis mongoliensis TaxID=715475 RepID=A0A9Y2NDU6_9PSEU|nr:ComEA family DNA-binding protein [Amycolatopsis sp. 4-36]WIY02071.1 ComEA family DNA-binding protein [Amycolatopsis sp. 4-36]
MFEQPARDPGPPVNDRLAWLADQLSPDASTVGPGGRLVRRWLPGGPAGAGRRRWAFAGVLVSVVVIVLGSVALFGGPPTPEPPPALPSAKPASEASARATPQSGLVVSVIGRVRSPGLVTVVQGARVADVLRAAGGADPGADLSALNLARRVTDGEQLAVGIPAPAAAAAGAAAGAEVDLNSASTDQLDTLPGVGEVTAQRIVQWRTEHGGFTKVEQLRDVPGIGESKFEKLREQVTVG